MKSYYVANQMEVIQRHFDIRLQSEIWKCFPWVEYECTQAWRVQQDAQKCDHF